MATMDLKSVIKPVTIRLLGTDLLRFQRFVLELKEKTSDLSISESEAANAAMRIIVRLSNDDDREKLADELKLEGKDREAFNSFGQWVMGRYLTELDDITATRDAMDKRKRKQKGGPTESSVE